MAESKSKTNKTWGLVHLDGTSKLQKDLKQKKKDEKNPRLWKTDWKK